jgi:hypothetical protein
MRPQPPAFTAIENLSRNINPISFPGGSSATSMWSPTMSGFAVQPTTNTIGVPTLVLDTMRPTTSVPSFQGTPYGITKLSPTTYQEDALNNILNKTGSVESKNNPSAFNSDTNAFGRYQILPSTALSYMKKYHGDMIDGMTDEQIKRSVMMNQELQKTIASDLTKENMASLQRYGIKPTDANTYMAHWFGAGGANEILKAASDTPVESIIGAKAASKNNILGMTTAEVISRASSAMKTAGAASNIGIGSAGGFGKVAEDVNPIFQSDTTPSVVSKIGDTTPDLTSRSLDRRVYAPDAVAAATKSPESFGDWLGSLFDQSGQVAKVLAEPNRIATTPGLPNTTSGMTKNQWADYFNVDPSEVKARVSTINGAPQVDYYSKELSDIPGEILKGIGEGIGSLFGNRDVNKMPQGSSVRDPRFLDMFSGSGREVPITESRGNDKISVNANSNMAAPVEPIKVASATPEVPVALGTGIDYTPRKYNPSRLLVPTSNYLPT